MTGLLRAHMQAFVAANRLYESKQCFYSYFLSTVCTYVCCVLIVLVEGSQYIYILNHVR